MAGPRPGGSVGGRYGSRGAVAGAVAAFGLLLILAVFTLFQSSHLLSNSCIGDSGQMVCPSSGPDWARPLPASAVIVSLLAGLTGLLAGRPVRTPALILGLVLTVFGLVAGLLLA